MYKFDGVRGIYLETVYDRPEIVYESVDILPESTRNVVSPPQTEVVCSRDMVAERLAALVGEKHVPYQPVKKIEVEQAPHEESEYNDNGNKVEVERGDRLEMELDSLEKALLAQSGKRELEVPRSSDNYSMLPLETMQLEQTFMDTRIPYAMARAPVVGRHLRLSLGLRGNSSVQLR